MMGFYLIRNGMSFIYNYPLIKLNTFGIDVKARRYAGFNSIENLLQLLETWKTDADELLILGGGSNVLFTKDFAGTVLKNEMTGISLVKEDSEHFYVKAMAGEVWHHLVMYCVERQYQGIENMALIPGCVGAAPMQNIGAYGVELKDIFEELEAVEIATGKTRTFGLHDCRFGYRESVFKHEARNRYVIVSVTLKLNRHPRFNMSYGNVSQQLEANGVKNPGMADIAEAVIQIRTSKLPDPAKIGNAGSFFKNPEIPAQQYQELKKTFPEIVGYPLNNEWVKLAAGWLIEQAGWKGKTFDHYGVHKYQALVLVNYGGATGQQVFDLSEQIISSVEAKFGVKLHREVNVY